MKRFLLCAAVTASLFFISCESSVSIKAKNDKSADIQLSLDLGKALENTVSEIYKNSGNGEFELFSKKEVEAAFAGSDFKNLSVSVPSKTKLTIFGNVPSPKNQKAFSDKGNFKAANFVTCAENSLTLIFSPETIQGIVSSLPQETQELFDLLMAPVLTGEEMSHKEYVDLVGSVYGEELAAEIDSALFYVSLECPENCTIKKTSLSNLKNAVTGQKKASFSIPLADFLCITKAWTFSITW